MSFFIIELALPTPLRRTFDYLPSQDTSRDEYRIGQRIKVVFANRPLIGLIVGIKTHTDVPENKLKRIEHRLDDAPIVDDESLTRLRWLAKYYHHPLGDVIEHALPARLRQGGSLDDVNERLWLKADLSAPVRGEKQRALQALFEQSPSWGHKTLTSQGFSAQIKAFAKDGRIKEQHTLVARQHNGGQQTPLALHHEQQQALDALIPTLGGFNVSLLEGVTGSGKTEVYLQLIQAALDKDQQILVLVPEIGLTPQTVRRFEQRFSVSIALLHSGLNDKERLHAWRCAKEALSPIVIGTRSAVFTPMPKLGLIVIDEEHDASFKQHDGFSYSARDFALIRAKQQQASVVLGSATPSLETLNHALEGRYKHLRIQTRAGHAKPPSMALYNTLNQPQQAGFVHPVLDKMHQHLSQGQQVLVFINRRGFSPVLSCSQCGWMSQCSHCDARMTLHKTPPRLHCHHCDAQQSIPNVCPSCGQGPLEAVGQGTQRLEQDLGQLFPNAPVLRIDRDSMKGREAFHDTLNTIAQGEPCILVGTQMLAKGHHFPNVTLVVVPDSDGGLFGADFRSMEHSAQLLLQVAGRSGREQRPGEVCIQTRYPDHPQLNTLIHDGYHALALDLLKERKERQLPPFRHLALLRTDDPEMNRAEKAAGQARAIIQQWLQGRFEGSTPITLVGPFPALMERRNGRYRFQLQIHAISRVALHQLLEALVCTLETQRLPSTTRWHLDVDPIDTL